MALRDMLARMMGQRAAGGATPPSFADLLQQESGRGDIAGQSARDRAAMRYNQMKGGPVSTAYRPPAPVAPDPVTTAATAGLPATAPAPTPRPSPAAGGLPAIASPAFPPDLAPSPNPYAPGSPVDPRASIGAFQGPPMPPSLPSDLAPSPNPYVPNSPVDPRASAGPPPLPMPNPARFGPREPVVAGGKQARPKKKSQYRLTS